MACSRALFLSQCSANNICFSTSSTTAGPLPLVRCSVVAQCALSDGFALHPQRIVGLVCVLYHALSFQKMNRKMRGTRRFSHLQDGGAEDKKVGEKIENVNLLRIFTTEKSL